MNIKIVKRKTGEKDKLIQLRVSARLKELGEERADELGLSMADYIRYLIAKDTDARTGTKDQADEGRKPNN